MSCCRRGASRCLAFASSTISCVVRDSLSDRLGQHNEAYDGWKTGGYPSYSLLSRRYLDRTLTCSRHLRSWLIERGYEASRVAVVKLGVDRRDLIPPSPEQRAAAKSRLLGLAADVPVIVTVARLDRQKRSHIVPDILARTRELVREADAEAPLPVLVMLGDGDLRDTVEGRIGALGLGPDALRLLGASVPPRPALIEQAPSRTPKPT